MPITLAKTLQSVPYTFYITTAARLFDAGGTAFVEIKQKFYQSKSHFDDGFVHIVEKDVKITNEQRVATIRLLLRTDYKEALSVVENFLVNNVGYYQGGIVINGEI